MDAFVILLIVASVPLVLASALYFHRRRKYPIADRSPWLSMLYIIVGVLFLASLAINQTLSDKLRDGCSTLALTNNIIFLPLIVFPFVIRAWTLLFKFELMNELRLAQNSANNTSSTENGHNDPFAQPRTIRTLYIPNWYAVHHRWSKPQFVRRFIAGVIAFLVLVWVLLLIYNIALAGDTCTAGFRFQTAFVIAIEAIQFIALVVLASKLSRHERDGLGIKRELTMTAVTGLCGVIAALIALGGRAGGSVVNVIVILAYIGGGLCVIVYPLHLQFAHKRRQRKMAQEVQSIRTLTDFLAIPECTAAFKEYLQKQLCSESLAFWQRARRYKTKTLQMANGQRRGDHVMPLPSPSTPALGPANANGAAGGAHHEHHISIPALPAGGSPQKLPHRESHIVGTGSMRQPSLARATSTNFTATSTGTNNGGSPMKAPLIASAHGMPTVHIPPPPPPPIVVNVAHQKAPSVVRVHPSQGGGSVHGSVGHSAPVSVTDAPMSPLLGQPHGNITQLSVITVAFREAKSIHDAFVAEGSPFEANVSANMRARCTAALKKFQTDVEEADKNRLMLLVASGPAAADDIDQKLLTALAGLFDESAQEVLKLMERDPYPRFRASPAYDQLVSGLLNNTAPAPPPLPPPDEADDDHRPSMHAAWNKSKSSNPLLSSSAPPSQVH